jgi:glutathione S-transferase
MMPRPLLRDNFNLTYRKIPVLALGRELYCDTSLIIETLEHFFPESEGYQTLYPKAADGRNYRAMIRGFASYWTDRPLFRVACGLMPASIWRSQFGRDREGLIGHKIDADKLERKQPEMLSNLDQQLSMLEPLFDGGNNSFVFSTSAPSLADISLYYELEWCDNISSGRYSEHISEGELSNESDHMELEGMKPVFNAQRYPGLYTWFKAMKTYLDNLPSTEQSGDDVDEVLKQMRESPAIGRQSLLLPTPRSTHVETDEKRGMKEGVMVAIAPDDTGKDE